MKKYASLLIFVFLGALFLPSIVLASNPQWSVNQSFIQTPYDGSTKSEFNITWDGATSVLIELNDTGTPYNCTASNTYGGNIWNCTLVLGANSGNQQYWKSYGENASETNTSDTWTFTISKAPTNVSLYLNGSQGNVSYNQYQIANFTTVVNSAELTIYMNSNYTGFLQQNGSNSIYNTLNLSSLGGFNITGYTDGNENYSASSTTYWFNVIDLIFSGSSTSIPSGSNYSSTANYTFSINLAGSVSSIIFESDFLGLHDYTMTNSTTYNNITITNNSNAYSISFPALAAGSYQYRWIANDTNNILISSQASYVINPFTVSPSLTESGNGPPWTEASSTPETLSCTSSYPVSLVISPCGSQTGSGNSVSCAVSTGTGTSSTAYTCSVSPVNNYTGSTTGVLNWGSSTLPPLSSPTSGSGSFSVTSSSNNVIIESGSSKTVTITLKNTLDDDMININISVSGIGSWYTLDKTSITKLRHSGGSDSAVLAINVPKDAEAKTYIITVTATGKDGITFGTLSNHATITLNVSKEEAPTNLTEETNETANQTLGEASANATSQSGFLTGLSINSGDFRNVVLFVGLLIAGLIFIFRNNITSFIKKGKIPMVKTYHRYSFFYSVKNKLSRLGHGIAIRLKIK